MGTVYVLNGVVTQGAGPGNRYMYSFFVYASITGSKDDLTTNHKYDGSELVRNCTIFT